MLGLFLAFVAGIVVCAMLSKEEDCPATVLGYDCQGDKCDHRKSELYKAKMNMALNQEQRDDDVNYWRGNNGN